jgi:hypothetical protein
MKKVLFTLATRGWQPEITELTFPLLKLYARKMGAEFHVIEERRFPDWPAAYEKLQIYELGRGNDYNVYIDADALVHPETPDITNLIGPDQVMHNAVDFAPIRWRYDDYFRRDGRNIGSCNWLTVAGRYCIDLWRPIDDMTPEQASANIFPTVEEQLTVKNSTNLIDDYAVARNIARFGLKFTTVVEEFKKLNIDGWFFWHQYTISPQEKLNGWIDREGKEQPGIKGILQQWRLL